MSGRVHEVSHLHKTCPNYLHIRAFRIYSEQTRSRQFFEHPSVPFSPVQTSFLQSMVQTHTQKKTFIQTQTTDLSRASSTYGLFRETSQLNKTQLFLHFHYMMKCMMTKNCCVLFDSNLSFDSHVSSICKTDFFILKIYLNWDLCQMQKY